MDDQDSGQPTITPEQQAQIDAYLKAHPYGEQDHNGVDLSLLRMNLRKTPSERLADLEASAAFFAEMDNARRTSIPPYPGRTG